MLAFTPVRVKTSDTFLAICLLFVSIAFSVVVLLAPRRVTPHEMPSLDLNLAETEAVVRADDVAAAGVPRDVHARALVSLVHAQGEAEASPGESPAVAADRELSLRAVVADVREATGEAGLLRIRAKLVSDLLPVMRDAHNDAASDRVLGSFHTILERYRLTEGGRLRAPWFVVRTLYKARINSIWRLEPTFRFAAVERRAFHGWLALAAVGAPLRERIHALEQYQAAGGTGALEALAVLTFENEEFDRAEELFTQLYAATGNVRYRNLALGSSREP